MSYYYTAPTALVDANPPRAPHDRLVSPDDPTLSFVVVNQWPATADRDGWESLPGVVEHPIWTFGQPVPPTVLAAFASLAKASPSDTVQQMFRRVGIRH